MAEMNWKRAVVVMLLSLTIIVAPMAPAWAALSAAGAASIGDHEMPVDAAGMDDCAAMMAGTAGADDCPCCATDNACPPALCLAKCFQFMAIAMVPGVPVLQTALQLHPAEPARPPDWSFRPQLPPPRT